MVGLFLSDVDAFTSSLKRGQAVNVNDQQSKERAIELAKRYFAEVRPSISTTTEGTDRLLEHDDQWQDLVRLAHGNNARKTYLKTLNTIRKQLRQFSVSVVARPPAAAKAIPPTSADEVAILKTLDALVPSAAASYRQGTADLAENGRTSYRGTATEFREALRETLDHLAPDAEVLKQDWYKPERDRAGPTMKQKVRYVLTSREVSKTQQSSAIRASELIDEMAGQVMRDVYSRASLATHIHQSKKEVEKIKRYVDTVLFDLLEIKTGPNT